jgi:MFS family permease
LRQTFIDQDHAGAIGESKREEVSSYPDPERVVASDASQRRHRSTLRLILSVFAPFAAGYYLAYLFRTINSAIAPALVSEFGLDASQMGLLASVYFLVFGLAQIPIGLFLDRFGPRRVQGVLLVIAAGGATLFGTASGFSELFIARAMIGLGVAGSLMAGLKAVVLWFPRERVALVNGWMIMLGALGAVTATVPTEWLLQLVGWRDLFEVLTVATAAVAGLIYMIVPEYCGDPEVTKSGRPPLTLRSICLDPRFLRVAPLSAACIGSSWALQSLWASAWLRDVEGFDRQSSLNRLFLMAVALSLGALLLGAVADRLRRHNIRTEIVLASVAALFVVAELALVLRLPLPSLLPWSVVSIAGAATVLSFAVIADYFPREFAARASGALNVFHFGWAFLVQYGIGLVIGQWTPEDGHSPVAAYQAAFGVTLALQAAALVWFFVPSRRALAKRFHSLFARSPAESGSKTDFVMMPNDGSILVAHEGVEW